MLSARAFYFFNRQQLNVTINGYIPLLEGQEWYGHLYPPCLRKRHMFTLRENQVFYIMKNSVASYTVAINDLDLYTF